MGRLHFAGRRRLGWHVAGGHRNPDEPVRVVFGVAPERMDVGIHKTGVLQAGRIHAVGDIGHAQSLEQLEDTRIVLFGIDRHRNEILPGAQLPGGIGRRCGG